MLLPEVELISLGGGEGAGSAAGKVLVSSAEATMGTGAAMEETVAASILARGAGEQ